MSRGMQMVLFGTMYILNSISNSALGMYGWNYWLKIAETMSWLVMWMMFVTALRGARR